MYLILVYITINSIEYSIVAHIHPLTSSLLQDFSSPYRPHGACSLDRAPRGPGPAAAASSTTTHRQLSSGSTRKTIAASFPWSSVHTYKHKFD